jgi:hypothetical protein
MFSFNAKPPVDYQWEVDLSVRYMRTPLARLPKWEAHRDTRAPPCCRDERVDLFFVLGPKLGTGVFCVVANRTKERSSVWHPVNR